MKFDESIVLDKWLSIECNDRSLLRKKHLEQGDKPRIGNRFMVVGAHGYLGWSTICQLAYKFPGCEIICLDKMLKINSPDQSFLNDSYSFYDKISRLKAYFDFTYEVGLCPPHNEQYIEHALGYYDPDVIIYLSSELDITTFCHQNRLHRAVPVIYDDPEYSYKDNLLNMYRLGFPLLKIHHNHIIGTYALPTLVDKTLSPPNHVNSILNSYIYSAITCKNIMLHQPTGIWSTSIENFTRTIIKSIRGGWEGHKIIHAIEGSIFNHHMADIVIKVFKKYYDIDVGCNVEIPRIKIETPEQIAKEIDEYKHYLDKFRIGLVETVAYSVINTVENNDIKIHDKRLRKKKTTKPSGDYKHFAVQKYPQSVSKYFMGKDFKSTPFIDKSTNIVSMGSCFAMEIADYLKKSGYNYPIYEEDEFNANWGIIFNSASIRQMVADAFGVFHPIERSWERSEGQIQDMFRRNTIYPKGLYKKRLQSHLKASKVALSKAEVLIVTLGLTEVWRDKRDHTVFWRVPPMECYDPDNHEFYVMTVEDVYMDLYRIVGIMRDHNPKCKIIFTVSPVPFQVTYRTDCDVVSANAYSKAVSSTAAIQFCSKYRNDGVYYFPSFEYVRYGFSNPYIEDGRHIKREVVNKMMKFFKKKFVKEKEK